MRKDQTTHYDQVIDHTLRPSAPASASSESVSSELSASSSPQPSDADHVEQNPSRSIGGLISIRVRCIQSLKPPLLSMNSSPRFAATAPICHSVLMTSSWRMYVSSLISLAVTLRLFGLERIYSAIVRDQYCS